MTPCLKCGNKYAYTSFQWQECPNIDCVNYSERIEAPNFAHHEESDLFLGDWWDNTWYSLFDLYLSRDLKKIRSRFGNEPMDFIEELIVDIDLDEGVSMDSSLQEGYARAKKLFGVK